MIRRGGRVKLWVNSADVSRSAISTCSAACAMITLVRALADCSVAVWLFDAETDNLGLAHVPRPIEPGDLLALADGPPLQVTVLVPLDAGGAVEALAEVEPVAPDCRPV